MARASSALLGFVDCETTGLDADLHEIWEVALIRVEHGKKDIEQTWMLPVDLGAADPVALAVGGFHHRHPHGYGSHADVELTSLKHFADTFAEMTYGPNLHLVGANPCFDEERLRKLLRRNGACPEWHYHKLDVESIVLGFAAAQGIAIELPYKSADLWTVVGINAADFATHTAMGDAKLVKAVWDKVMDGTE